MCFMENFCQTLPTLLLSTSLLSPDCKWNRFKKILTIAVRMQETYKNSMVEVTCNFHQFSLTFSFLTLPRQLKLLLDKGSVYSNRTKRISRKHQHQNQRILTTLHLDAVWQVSKRRKGLQSAMCFFPYSFVSDCHFAEMMEKLEDI